MLQGKSNKVVYNFCSYLNSSLYPTVRAIFLILGSRSFTLFDSCNYCLFLRKGLAVGLARLGFGVLLVKSFLHLDASVSWKRKRSKVSPRRYDTHYPCNEGKHSLGLLRVLDL